MVLACMVHHEVEAEGDPLFMALLCQLGQIVHGTELRLHLPEIRHGIAAVAAAARAFEQRHKMKIVHAAVADIIQFFPNAGKISGKSRDIHLHAEHVLLFIPIRIRKALFIKRAKLLRPLGPCTVKHGAKGVQSGLAVIQFQIDGTDLRGKRFHTIGKFFFPSAFGHGFLSFLQRLSALVVHSLKSGQLPENG